MYEYAATAIGPIRPDWPNFPARKIDVGPSAPPMIDTAAAALSLNPNKIAMKYAPKTVRPKSYLRKLVWGTMATAASVAMIIALRNRGVSEEVSENAQIVDQMESLEGMKYLTYLEKFEMTIDMAEMLALEMENND